MSQTDTAAMQDPGPGLSQYLIGNPKEILAILRAVMETGAMISLYFGRGGEFVLTSLIAFDGDSLVLDPGKDEPLNRRLLASDRLLAVTQHARVRVQFPADHLVETVHEGRRAFSMPVPTQLLRLQRRENYRLAAPLARPPRCEINLPGRGRVEARVLDISCGGIAVIGYPPGVEIEVGQLFGDCRIELPDVGTIAVTMRVKNAFEVTLKNGTRSRRSGCEFVSAPESTLSTIQRYIIRIDRERRSRLGGFA